MLMSLPESDTLIISNIHLENGFWQFIGTERVLQLIPLEEQVKIYNSKSQSFKPFQLNRY